MPFHRAGWWFPPPGVDGLALLQKFRQSGRSTPVMLVTSRVAIPDRVCGLDAGADDYLCKPFAFEELFARIRALARRASGAANAVVSHGDLRLDVLAHRAERAGRQLDLTAREEALLLFFLRHPGAILSYSRIYEEVWEEQYDRYSNTLQVHVMGLRKKLEVHGVRLIHTVRGEGYSFGEEPK
ncbi:MAG: response regulator transcription factor [Planctomycetes bacterium]|nr:response regulator transcription factor [Planctomycetota bacterium]